MTSTTTATPTTININDEYESSTTLHIRRRTFDQLLVEYPPIKSYSIFYFINGTRKSDDRIEYKINKKRFNLIHILYKDGNILMLPYVRRYAEEIETTVPQNLNEIESVIMRHVIFEEKTESYSLRIAVEYKNCDFGVTHQITAEVEYGKSIFYYHESVKLLERIMFNHIGRIFSKVLPMLTTGSIYEFENPRNICNVPSRIFNMFSTSYSNNKMEIKSYKWDGYKGRIYIHNKILYYYDDMHNVIQTACRHLEEFENIFFQIEVLDGVIIITDVLGGYIGNALSNQNLYMPEPLDVILFFHSLRKRWEVNKMPEPFELDLKTMGKFQVRTQYHLTKTSPTPEDLNLPNDGKIITTPNKIFKFKPPTLDVRMVNGALHIDHVVASISPQTFKTGNGTDAVINNAIYEITPLPQSTHGGIQYEILKRRFDRNFTSTVKQWKSFLEEIKFFNAHSK